MSLAVGTNSYVTVEEATDYISAVYRDTNICTNWISAIDEDKELLLELACADMESLPFIGRKKHHQQELMFPRAPFSSVPRHIKAAQIEMAILPLKEDAGAINISQRVALQKQGVKSFSLGDLSESYVSVNALIEQYTFLADEKVNRLLSKYLSGGYATC